MSFIEKAIANIYGVKIVDEQGFATLRGRTLADFERNLSIRFQKTFLEVNVLIETANQEAAADPAKRGFLRWNAHVEFDSDDPFSVRSKVTFRPPQNNNATSLFLNHFGSDRFLFVSVSGLVNPFLEDESSRYWNQHWGPMELFKRGITFGGRVYHYFGGEAQSKKNLSLLEKENSPDRCLLLWFFNEDNGTDTIISIHEARNRFGQLSVLPPGKCNARLKLGFSHIYPIKIDERCIRMVDDIPATIVTASSLYTTCKAAATTKKIMTDGCGLISIDLARSLPYAISHGVLHANYPKSRGNTMPAASIIQVRCASIRGLFKGCLVVIDDPSVCPVNTVIFRPSMLKSTGPTHPPYPHGKAMLGIVNTFEHPQWMNIRHNNISSFTSRLSRPLCLLLHHLGVPAAYFIELMNAEIDKILLSLQDRKCALRLIKEQLNDSLQMIGNNHGIHTTGEVGEEDEDSSDGDEGDDDTTTVCTDAHAILHTLLQSQEKQESEVDDAEEIVEDGGDFFPPLSSSSSSNKNSNPFLARYVHLLSMLLSSQQLAEPYLQEQLRKLALNKVKRLERCSLRIKNAMSLVGAPDPYGYLQENEVYISFPSDRTLTMHNSALLSCEGRVIVTRNPMQHPGDIRSMIAVNHPLLQAHFTSQTNGGVIFFSTQGQRSAGDMMSGGDYDGDLYLVLYGRDDLVMTVRDDVSPYEDKKAAATTAASNEDNSRVCSEHLELIQHHTASSSASSNPTVVCRVCLDHKGVLMYRGLLKVAQQQHVGRYSNAWLAWADRDPLGDNALACGEIVRIALDAQKSGEAVPHRPDLLKKSLYPDFMQPATVAYARYQASNGNGYGSSPGRYNKSNKDNSSSRKKAARPLEQQEPMQVNDDEHAAKKRNQNKAVFPSDMDVAPSTTASAAINKAVNESQMSDITYDMDNLHWLAEQEQAADEAMAMDEAYAAPPSPFFATATDEQQERSFPSSPDDKQPLWQQYSRRGQQQGGESILSQLHRLLYEKTHSLHQENKLQQLYIDTDMLIVVDDERLNHHSLFKTRKKEQLITITDFEQRKYGGLTHIFPLEHHREVLNDVMMCVRDYNRDWSNILSSSNLSNREVMIQKMKEKHYAIFDERARRWSELYNLPLQTARERVAGIFYIATYTAAQQAAEQRGRTGGLSFCWEVCGVELNLNKRRVSLVRQQQSIYAVMALQEMMFL